MKGNKNDYRLITTKDEIAENGPDKLVLPPGSFALAGAG